MFFWWIVKVVLADIFDFSLQREYIVRFKIPANNICSGSLKPYDPNAKYKVKIEAKVMEDGVEQQTVVYLNDILVGTKEVFFSFNTQQKSHVTVTMSVYDEETFSKMENKMLQLNFDSKLDTFNKTVSSNSQLKPALFAIIRVIKQISGATQSAMKTEEEFIKVGNNYKDILRLILFFSFCSFVMYVAFNIGQIILLKKYLLRKKVL